MDHTRRPRLQTSTEPLETSTEPLETSTEPRPEAGRAVESRTIHLLGHATLLGLALVALMSMTQACSGGTGDAGFDGNYGYGD